MISCNAVALVLVGAALLSQGVSSSVPDVQTCDWTSTTGFDTCVSRVRAVNWASIGCPGRAYCKEFGVDGSMIKVYAEMHDSATVAAGLATGDLNTFMKEIDIGPVGVSLFGAYNLEPVFQRLDQAKNGVVKKDGVKERPEEGAKRSETSKNLEPLPSTSELPHQAFKICVWRFKDISDQTLSENLRESDQTSAGSCFYIDAWTFPSGADSDPLKVYVSEPRDGTSQADTTDKYEVVSVSPRRPEGEPSAGNSPFMKLVIFAYLSNAYNRICPPGSVPSTEGDLFEFKAAMNPVNRVDIGLSVTQSNPMSVFDCLKQLGWTATANVRGSRSEFGSRFLDDTMFLATKSVDEGAVQPVPSLMIDLVDVVHVLKELAGSSQDAAVKESMAFSAWQCDSPEDPTLCTELEYTVHK